MAFITTQCQRSAEPSPHDIGPEDSCFDLPLDHIRELLAELGERPRLETDCDINRQLQAVEQLLVEQERQHAENQRAFNSSEMPGQ